MFYNSSITGLESVVYKATEAALGKISALGGEIVDPADIPTAREIFESNKGPNDLPSDIMSSGILTFIIRGTEFKVGIASYLEGLVNSSARTLADIIKWGPFFFPPVALQFTFFFFL